MTAYRLLTYRSETGPRAGLAVGDRFADTATATGVPAYATVLGILEDWAAAEPRLRASADSFAGTHAIADADLLVPVHHPVTIYCAGANYTDHVERMAAKLNIPVDPDPHEVGLKPWHFLKPSRSGVGPDATVALRSSQMDWEIELAAVIGTTARNVPIDQALRHVAGYTVANDLSARDLTRRQHIADVSPFKYDWIGQKCFDGACPLGPWIVPASAIADPQALSLRLWVNEVLHQDSNTSRMIFTLAEQIAHLSSCLTLHPGDVILTGTPSGVGAETGTFLKAGDVVRAEITGIGVLSTTIGAPVA